MPNSERTVGQSTELQTRARFFIVVLAVVTALSFSGSASADTAEEAANRLAAIAVFEQIYNVKNFEAAATHLGERFIQHTPSIADGRDGLQRYVERLEAERPRSSRAIKRILTDRNHVVIQAHFQSEPGDRGAVTGDIFRFDEGLAVEHWSIVHPITDSPHPDNPNDVFGTASAPYPPATSTAR